MTAFQIERAGPLSGTVPVQGSKNTILPILAASLINPGKTVLHNVPRIRDVENMVSLMREIGCRVIWEKRTLTIDAEKIRCGCLPKEAAVSMRSSINLLAPLLVRCGCVEMNLPGGCSLGKRPIDLHLHALERMGAAITIEDDQIHARASGFRGAEICFRFPSVGATQQALTAAAAAEGETRIMNAAREPEVVQLCCFLKEMGITVRGEGTSMIQVTGSANRKPVEFHICADRIVAATCMSAVAVCGGSAYLAGVRAPEMEGITAPFMEMGCEAVFDPSGLRISRTGTLKPISYIETKPYPGFPMDVQSLLLAVLTQADGQSVVKENVFEARFRAAYQLQKMGADIIIDNNCAMIRKSRLKGTLVEAPDLRGGAALVIAGLAAEGTTYITGCEHISRGYEDLAGMLRQLGVVGAVLTETELL